MKLLSREEKKFDGIKKIQIKISIYETCIISETIYELEDINQFVSKTDNSFRHQPTYLNLILPVVEINCGTNTMIKT